MRENESLRPAAEAIEEGTGPEAFGGSAVHDDGPGGVIASVRPEFGPRNQINDAEASAFLSRLHHAPLNDADKFCLSAKPKDGKWDDLPLIPLEKGADGIAFSFAAVAKEFGDIPAWMPPRHAGINLDVYASVCEFASGAQGRCADDAVSIPGLWADLDVKPGNAQLPQSREELDRVLAELPPVSMLVDSGSGGAHAYWLFTERQAVTDETRDLTERWIRYVSGIASNVLGRRIEFDAVGDLARVMRVPGSVNQKVHETVRLVVGDGPSYSPQEFVAFLGTPSVADTSALEPARVETPATPTPAWVAGSVTAKVHAVQTAPDGKGNDTINDMAFQIGQYIPRGWVDFDAVRVRLEAAVESWQHPDPKYKYTINRSLRQGMAKPYVSRTGNDEVSEEDYFENQVWKRVMYLRADEEARRRRAQASAIPSMSVSDALDLVLSGGSVSFPSVCLIEDDPQGRGLFYLGHVNGIYGDRSAGKSTVQAEVQARVLNEGGIVVHFEFDNNPTTAVIKRLLNAGADPVAIRSRFMVLRSLADRDGLTPDVVTNTRLVTLDAMDPAIGSLGEDPYKPGGVDAVVREYFAPFTQHGACGVFIDHIGHDNTDRQAGAKRKINAPQGAVYELKRGIPLRPGRTGLSSLYLRKDNLGALGDEGRVVAQARMRSLVGTEDAPGRVETSFGSGPMTFGEAHQVATGPVDRLVMQMDADGLPDDASVQAAPPRRT
jgi:hypothetical protein